MAKAFIVTFELLDKTLLEDLYQEENFTTFYKDQISLKIKPDVHLKLPICTLFHKIENDVSVGDVCMNFIDMLERHMQKEYKLQRVCVVGNDGQCAAADCEKIVYNIICSPENMFCIF